MEFSIVEGRFVPVLKYEAGLRWDILEVISTPFLQHHLLGISVSYHLYLETLVEDI